MFFKSRSKAMFFFRSWFDGCQISSWRRATGLSPFTTTTAMNTMLFWCLRTLRWLDSINKHINKLFTTNKPTYKITNLKQGHFAGIDRGLCERVPWTRSLCPWQVSVPSWIWRGSLQPEWATFHHHHVFPHHRTFGLYPMWHLCLLAKILGSKFSQSPITRSIKCGIWAFMGPSNPKDHWTHLGSNSILLTLTKIQEKNWFIQLFVTFS